MKPTRTSSTAPPLLLCLWLPACSLLNNDIDDDAPRDVDAAPVVAASDGARPMTTDGSVQDNGERIENGAPTPTGHSGPPAAPPPPAEPASPDAETGARADAQAEPVGDAGTLSSIAAYGGDDANFGYGIATDRAGNLYVTGAFQHEIAFGSLPAHATAGNFDAYVVKFDSDGTPLWSRSFGASGDDRGFRIAAGGDGDVVVVGAIQDSVTFDGVNLGSGGVASGYVAKLSAADGTVLWAHALPRTGGYRGSGEDHAASLDGWPSDVVVDASDGVYVTGPYAEPFDFGGLQSRRPAGLVASYLVRYESDGALAGFHIFDSSGATLVTALALDHADNLVLTGLVDGAADFDGGESNRHGMADAFVMKVASRGQLLWSTRFGSAAFDCGTALMVTADDDIVAVGTFDANLSWGRLDASAGSGRSIYLARLDPNGSPRWLEQMDSEDHDSRGLGVVALPTGIALAGTFRSTLAFDDGSRLQTAAQQDMFVARFGNDGSLSWAHGYGGDGDDEAWDIAADGSGNLAVTGWFAGPVEFSASPTPSAGQLAVPLLRLRP